MRGWGVAMFDLLHSLVAVLIFAGGLAFMTIMRLIHSHSVYLYGHRRRTEEGTNFRVAIQNAESVPLDGCFRAELICGAGGAFLKRPQIFAGPRGMRGELSDDKRRYSLEFDQLPAYDTWVILCDLRVDAERQKGDGRATSLPQTMGDALGLTLRLREIDEDGNLRQRSLRRISVDQLVISANDSIKVVGRARKPLIPLGFMMVLLSTAAYALTASFWIWRSAGIPALQWLEWPWDAFALLGIVATASFFLINAAPPPARSIQGYLDETPVTRNISSSSRQPKPEPQTT
jgi:hypothetical protein